MIGCLKQASLQAIRERDYQRFVVRKERRQNLGVEEAIKLMTWPRICPIGRYHYPVAIEIQASLDDEAKVAQAELKIERTDAELRGELTHQTRKIEVKRKSVHEA